MVLLSSGHEDGEARDPLPTGQAGCPELRDTSTPRVLKTVAWRRGREQARPSGILFRRLSLPHEIVETTCGYLPSIPIQKVPTPHREQRRRHGPPLDIHSSEGAASQAPPRRLRCPAATLRAPRDSGPFTRSSRLRKNAARRPPHPGPSLREGQNVQPSSAPPGPGEIRCTVEERVHCIQGRAPPCHRTQARDPVPARAGCSGSPARVPTRTTPTCPPTCRCLSSGEIHPLPGIRPRQRSTTPGDAPGDPRPGEFPSFPGTPADHRPETVPGCVGNKAVPGP